MNPRSMAHDVKNAIERAKHKISSLESELVLRESCSESEEELHQLPWKHKQELKDSLVNMYKANPKVNEELKQRLPSPVKRHCSETIPQLGFSGCGSNPDISQSASEKETLDKKFIKGTTDEDHEASKVRCDTRKQTPVLDREKNIAFLLRELDSLRVLNKKLQDKLALREKELETVRLDQQLQEAELEARACERAAVLVEEVYKAQRDRDQAVMARLRLANEERDEALLRAKKLQEAALQLENINPEDSDMDVEELLHRVSSADSALSIERSGAAILERIERARERRSKIMSEEMSAVMGERDKALGKCKRLEQEVLYSRERRQTTAGHMTSTHHQEQEGKVELEAAQRERDMAVEVCRRLEEELRSLRSAQQSQAEECGRKEALPARGEEGPGRPALLGHVWQLTAELQDTQNQLHLLREAERAATEKVQKLERLVDVLRKKVGTGSVRTVI